MGAIYAEGQAVGIQYCGSGTLSAFLDCNFEIYTTYPSGRILIIWRPMIRDEFCKILEGFTHVSDTDSSESKKSFVKATIQAPSGIYTEVRT